MALWIQLLIGAGSGLFIIIVSAILFWRPGINILIDGLVKRLLKDPYQENIGEMYNVFTKIGIQNIFECDLRGTTGEPLQRPFGSPRHLSPWDKLVLSPTYLTRKPTIESISIDTKVTIGPQAKRPLDINMPILISGMAYGIALSINSKVALAKGADKVNTATNTGAGPFLPEERKHTKRLIIQYHRGFWGKEEEVLRQANAIEIQMGYGAYGSAPMLSKYRDLSPEFHAYMHLKPGQDLLQTAMLPNVKNEAELTELVNYLRKLTNGVPIGVKFGATHYLEKELDIFCAAGIDFLSLAGGESGIHYGPGILADDLGLPTLPALCRTVSYLKQHNLKNKISLIVSGGLYTPGQFLKAIALGADAVAIGTIAIIALAHTQITKVIPWEPLTELVYDNGKSKNKLSADSGAKSIANFLKSCNEEIIMALRSMGWSSLKQVSSADLAALTPDVAKMTGVELGLFTPGSNRNTI